LLIGFIDILSEVSGGKFERKTALIFEIKTGRAKAPGLQKSPRIRIKPHTASETRVEPCEYLRGMRKSSNP
jgi:hypothetical protein